ncbi:MAG: leucine-rich repeat protein [Paludibacteraceae bacterium]|nr:leucine-rich repeat protein [Paludibacteraceae bacterium]
MRKFYLLVLGLMVSLWTNAFTVIDRNGIEYEVSENGSFQAVITGRIPSKFVKVLTISATVPDKQYPIIGVAEGAFMEDEYIEEVTINDENFLFVGKNAFNGCSNLKTFIIRDSYSGMEIDEGAFSRTGLTAIYMPYLSYVGYRAFAYCPNLKTVYLSDMNKYAYNILDGSPVETLLWENSLDSEVEGANAYAPPLKGISSTLKTVYAGGKIPDYFAMDFWNLETVYVSSSAQSIGQAAFLRCDKLSTIEFRKDTKLTTIGANAFAGNAAEFIDLSNATALRTIGASAFANSENLKSLIITSNAGLDIDEYAFSNCNVYQLTIKNAIKTIAANAFNETSVAILIYAPTTTPKDYSSAAESPFSKIKGLYQLRIGEQIKKIGAYSFSGLSSLLILTFEGDSNGKCELTEIGESAFANTGLKQVTLPATLTTLGSNAFNGSQITNVTIPASVTKLGSKVFGSTLTELTYNATNASFIGNTGSNYGIFQVNGTITIGSNVTAIPDRFNINAQKFSYIAFPESVEKIGILAFSGNNALKIISLPANIQSLGTNAFGNCSTPKVLTISGAVPAPNGSFTGATVSSIYCNCSNESQVQSKWASVCSNIVSQGTADYPLPTMNESMMAGRGTVTWSAQQGCDPNRTATATPNSGYTFVRWSDGVTSRTRTINLQTYHSDFPLYAFFVNDADYTTLTADVQPAGAATLRFSDPEGTVHKDGKYLAGRSEGPADETTAILTPSFDENEFTFNSWEYEGTHEGAVTEDPYTHVLTISLMYMEDAGNMGGGLVAQFPQHFTLRLDAVVKVDVQSNNNNLGRAYVTKNGDDTWTITADPFGTCKFIGWDDNGDGVIDNTESVRTVAPAESTTYTAYFDELFIVHVIPRGSGSVEIEWLEGEDMYNILKGEKVTLQAVLGENTIFRGWYVDDVLVSTKNPYVLTESIGANYYVICEIEAEDPSENSFMANVTVDPAEGGTIVSNVALEYDGYASYNGFVPENFEWILTAEPAKGYEFVGWEYMMGEDIQGTTENPLTIYTKFYDEAMPAIGVTAAFQPTQGQGIENIELTREPHKVLVDGVIYIVRDGKLFNLQGARVK